jgi:eukaryotic-like serine/threonine-protein kinase
VIVVSHVDRTRRSRAIFASAIASAIALTVFLTTPSLASAGTGDWPMWGDGPAHDSFNRAESVLSPSSVGGLHVVRTYPNWDPVFGDWPYQVVVGNYGFSAIPGPVSGYYHYIAAFNLSSGAVAWRHRIATQFNYWGYVPAVRDGVLYVGGASAMYAFDATTGAVIWVRYVHPGSNFNMTTVHGDMVYASTYDTETVYAFDAATGRVVWRRTPYGCCLTGPISVKDGLAYVLNGALHVYDAATGTKVFTTRRNNYYETPAVNDGVVYIQTANSLVALNAITGALLWSSHTMSGNAVSSLTPAVDGKTVVVGTTRYLIAFNAMTGARRWTIDGGSDFADYLVPSIANGVVYAGSIGGGMQAIDERTGDVLFSADGICWSPIVAHSRIYVACNDGMTVFGL